MTRRSPRRVYFIKPIGMDGPIKIGCSIAPDNRRETLETWAPFPLEVAAEIEGDFGLERQFHTLFLDSYIKHEWFRWTPELQGVIERIRSGSFDISTLPVAVKRSQFRKPRNNRVYTDEWRYQASVKARFRHRSGYPYWNPEFKKIVGDDLHGDWLPHRAEIDALLERLPVQTKRKLAA